MSVPLKEIIEELQFLGDRISTQVRTIAFSLIAFVWVLLTANGSDSLNLTDSVKRQLVVSGGLAIAAMFFDFLQYFLGFVYTNSLRKKVEESETKKGDYDYDDWRYRGRNALFWIKQAVLALAVVWMGVALVSALVLLLGKSG